MLARATPNKDIIIMNDEIPLGIQTWPNYLTSGHDLTITVLWSAVGFFPLLYLFLLLLLH